LLGNIDLIVGEHIHQCRQAKTASLPRRTACCTNGKIGFGHQRRHIIDESVNCATARQTLMCKLNCLAMRRITPQHNIDTDLAPTRGDCFEDSLCQIVLVHSTQGNKQTV